MLSHQEILDILATEAVEGVPDPRRPCHSSVPERRSLKPREQGEELTVHYNLRLVVGSDGSYTWID